MQPEILPSSGKVTRCFSVALFTSVLCPWALFLPHCPCNCNYSRKIHKSLYSF